MSFLQLDNVELISSEETSPPAVMARMSRSVMCWKERKLARGVEISDMPVIASKLEADDQASGLALCN